MSQRTYQPLHTDNPSLTRKSTPGEKDDRKAQSPTAGIICFLLTPYPLRSQNEFQEIPSCDTVTQEEFVACLERIKDVIKDNLANEELQVINDPAEIVLDRLAVSLDWMLITAVIFMIMSMSYLRSPAFAALGDAKTHELYQKLVEITNDKAMNDIFLRLLAQTPKTPLYTFSRGLVRTSVLSSCLFAFLAILGKLFIGRNGLYLDISSRRKSPRQFFFRPSPFVSRWLMLALKPLPNIFMLNQLLLGTAFVIAHYLAV
ncbi:uncharacterized protein F5147DRAFT_762325 [Suillus discolor]|uniref:Uncharacterized protein n=1 Tax=Suillus discolor TaxID=1912936 RepID=A0A9P7F2C8_9AGAM|nr:uncharacterized protein F5147DRAFT_762325 [Suillus discolor]KAG2103443.1 hypothetical protein F5147DRAFT_762325 [Suillus discolor]